MPGLKTIVAEQFDSAEQQHDAARLGLWTFLATEILFFGGLFTAYTVYRHAYPNAFAAGSNHNNLFLGTLNTAVLLTSSLTMAFAVHAAQVGRARSQIRWLLVTIVFAFGFLVIKGLEYNEHFVHHLFPGPGFTNLLNRKTELFFVFYFIMTGLHAIHVLVGIGALSMLAWTAFRRPFSESYFTPVELCGLYWHFVDIVWVFLYPLLYLINRHL
jgi:cytochrome c oxidase subunit 3